MTATDYKLLLYIMIKLKKEFYKVYLSNIVNAADTYIYETQLLLRSTSTLRYGVSFPRTRTFCIDIIYYKHIVYQ